MYTKQVVSALVGAVVGVGVGVWIAPEKKGGEMMKDESTMGNSAMMESHKDGVMVGGALMVRTMDIVENALNANNVTTVVAAVKAAGLVDTLRSPGPFTVFAPDNAAFEKLPAGTVETLLKPENKDKLTAILTHHVVAGAALNTSELKNGQVLTTVNGTKLTVKIEGGQIWVGNAKIITPDVISKNGTTHVIDTVLIP